MAPVSAPMDFHAQTIENLRFISRQGAKITIITAREPLGGIKVIALKAQGRKREAFLSGTGGTFREALEDLHSKSADATQNYISVNGFEFISVPKKRDSHDSDSESVHSDSTSSTVTASGSDSSGDESLSDDETVSIASGHSARKKTKRKSRQGRGRKGESDGKTAGTRQSRSPSRSRSRSRSRSPSRAIDSDDEAPKRLFPPPMGVHSNPARFLPRANCPPPPPPPGWANRPMPPRMPGTVGMPRPHTLPPPPPPQAGAPGIRLQPFPTLPPTMPMPAPTYNARLHIKWPKHGEKLVLIRTPASVRAIELAAMNFVRRSPHSFAGVTTSDSAPSRLNLLRATVRRAAVDGEDYDMAVYSGDDLRALVEHASQGSIPRFDVDLGVPPPPPMPAVGLVAGSV